MHRAARYEAIDRAEMQIVHGVNRCVRQARLPNALWLRRPPIPTPTERGTKTSPPRFFRLRKDSEVSDGHDRPPSARSLGSLTRQELAQQVTYLKTENQILRSRLPDRIQLNNQEKRRLVKHGLKLGGRFEDLISVASYSTFRKPRRFDIRGDPLS